MEFIAPSESNLSANTRRHWRVVAVVGPARLPMAPQSGQLNRGHRLFRWLRFSLRPISRAALYKLHASMLVAREDDLEGFGAGEPGRSCSRAQWVCCGKTGIRLRHETFRLWGTALDPVGEKCRRFGLREGRDRGSADHSQTCLPQTCRQCTLKVGGGSTRSCVKRKSAESSSDTGDIRSADLNFAARSRSPFVC